MSRKLTVNDYPEHLNPFDENYHGVAEPPINNRQKYNTWSSRTPNQISTLAKPKPSLLEKPWAALNLSPKGKIVRRLSILKTAVERLASKKHRLAHSASYTEGTLPSRSHSVHDDFNFRIISPKLKEKLRQQAFSSSVNAQEPAKDSAEPSSPQVNGRLTLNLKSDVDDPSISEDASPTSPESGKDMSTLGARPKARKKRPPPPPPAEATKTNNLHQPSSDDS